MKNFRFLRFLDKFKNVYKKFGVDYDKMRLILGVKLTLDRRRTYVIASNQDSKKQGVSSYALSFFVYAVMGLFIGMMTFLSINNMVKFSIIFAMFIFIILTAFISDFSSVLLDVRDKQIIGTKGIDSRTINAAKITHICYYVMLITIAVSWLSIPTMFQFGVITGLVFIVELIVADFFLIVLTALVYLLILRLFDGEKVKDIINIVRIGFTILMTVGYQFFGGLADLEAVHIAYSGSWWNLLLPPMWFAAPLYSLSTGNINSIVVALIIIAFVVPIAAMIIYIKNTSKFEDSLYKLNIMKNHEKEKSKGLFYALGRKTCRNSTEKASYDLAWCIMKRERKFKLTTYPNLAMLVIFPAMFLFIFGGTLSGSIWNMPIVYSLNVYFFIIMIPTILTNLQFSENHKASWVYKALYIKDKSCIYKGAYKTLLFNMLFPLYILECIIFVIIFGKAALLVLLTAFIFMTATIAYGHVLGKLPLPFSKEAGIMSGQGNIGVFFIEMIIGGLAALINYLVMSNIILTIIYDVVLAAISLFLWKKCIK